MNKRILNDTFFNRMIHLCTGWSRMTQSMSTHSLFTVAPVLRCDRRELTERSRERKTSIRAKSNDPMTTNTIKQKFAQIRSRSATFGWKIINDWSFSLSSLLAYNLLISLLPMILCIFAVASLVFANDPDTMAEIRSRLLNAFPKAGLTEVLDALLASLSKQAGLVFIISFIVAIFTSSRLFIAIDDVLTIIYRIRERTILNQNIQAIKMLLAFVILTPFIIIVSSIPAVIRSNQIFYQFLISLFTGAVSFLLLNIIYRLVPLRKISWRNTYVERTSTSFSNSISV